VQTQERMQLGQKSYGLMPMLSALVSKVVLSCFLQCAISYEDFILIRLIRDKLKLYHETNIFLLI